MKYLYSMDVLNLYWLTFCDLKDVDMVRFSLRKKFSELSKMADPRSFLQEGFWCKIRVENQWKNGIIDHIFIGDKCNQDWLIVKYDNDQFKVIQRFCDDLKPGVDFCDPRMDLCKGCSCLVWSRSGGKWHIGKVEDRFLDQKTNEEWFLIKYGDDLVKKKKKMQRFCEDLDMLCDGDPLYL